MPSNYSSLTVTWYDEDGAGGTYNTSADITADVKSIPMFTDTGTGEVNAATIVLRALDGKYIVSSTPAEIEEFDRIRIQVTDLGGNSYDRYFEIVNRVPSQSKTSGGTLFTLECLGIEYHTQHIMMTKPYYFEDSYTVALSAGDLYERNRGTKQPILSNYNVLYDVSSSGYGNDLPWYNSNNWEFGLNEESVYNRWMDLITGAGAAVSAGGALTFYELNFLTTGVNTMNFKLRASGSNTPTVTIENSVVNAVKVGEQEGMMSNPTGTNVMAWGGNDFGTLPTDYSRYYSGFTKFKFRPEWATSVVYAAGAKIKVTSTNETISPSHYECPAGQGHTSGTFSTDLAAGKWVLIDMAEEFGNSIQYSPWTDGKARVITNCGANPGRANFTNAGWFDINTVVNSENFFRTWVDVIISGTNVDTDAALDTLAATYSYDATRVTFPRGFRVLLDDQGTATGDLAGFENQIIERIPVNSTGAYTWARLYSFNIKNTGLHIANLDDGKVYQDTITGVITAPTHSWAAIDGDDYANDCFHPYSTAPTNVQGSDLAYDITAATRVPKADVTDSTRRPDITKAGGVFAQNQDSAINFTSQVIPSAPKDQDAATDASTQTASWYGATVGFNMRFPYPNNLAGSIAENIGELYGGGATNTVNSSSSLGPIWVTGYTYEEGNIVFNSTTRYICLVNHTAAASFSTDLASLYWRVLLGEEPATVDMQNGNFTHDGQDGFNAIGSASEDYGQISAIAFWAKFEIAGNLLDGEHNFRAFFMDTKDNVVYQDFIITHGANWEEIRLPIGGFRNYRGVRPIAAYVAPLSDLFPPKDLEIINIFEWRNTKIFGVQYQEQYDEFGRFNPGNATINSAGDEVFWGNILNATRTLIIDGVRFIKPLLATSGNVTDRNLEPDFQQFPNIEVYDQLVNAAKSQLEVEKFKHKEFNIESTGDEIFDILFGESFYLKNTDLVSDADPPAPDTPVQGQIKLVAKRIEYSITKPPAGKGGLRRKINGSKVFT